MCLAIPAKVLSINKTTAEVECFGIRQQINIQLIDQINLGDYVLVHAGFAIEKVREIDYQFIQSTFKDALQ